MAAAIILVPEMLSGPPEPKRGETPRASGETPVKTYTIDFSRPPSVESPTEDVPDTRAPPSEMPPPAAAETPSAASGGEAPQADPEPKSAETAAPAVSNAPPEAKAPPAASTESVPPPKAPTPVTAPVSAPPAPVASGGSAPTSKAGAGWAVQLGSFSTQATAERLSAELRAEGYEAFVMPVKASSSTLYRVRIGPMPSREQADATLRKVKGKVPGAAIVPHR